MYTPVRVLLGIRMRNRPATRPPWRTAFGSPRRDTTQSKLRSTGPTSRCAYAPAVTADSGPRRVKRRTETPVPGRATAARGTGRGASVWFPARSRTATVKA